MPETLDNAIQIGIYNCLIAHAPLIALLATDGQGNPAIYDNGYQFSSPDIDVEYPYITFGDDIVNDWSTDTADGGEAVETLHVWSRAGSMREAKAIIGEIKRAMTQTELDIPDHEFIACKYQGSTCVLDPDMETIHGTIQMRIHADQLDYGANVSLTLYTFQAFSVVQTSQPTVVESFSYTNFSIEAA